MTPHQPTTMTLRSHRRAAALDILVNQINRFGLASMKSERDVRGFHYLTEGKSIAKVIDSVEVMNEAVNFSSLRLFLEILRRTKNITSLTLKYSSPPNLRHLPTAHNQVFRNLNSLSVNAPHNTVAVLLFNHPQLRHLVLGTCDALYCPFIDLNLPLLQLQELTCPPGCVQALAQGSHLTQLISFHGSPQDASFPMPRLFNFATKTFALLHTLHIDFHHVTTRLLGCISAAAPALTVLRLTESMFTVESEQLIWDDADAWGDDLRSLRCLERLLLRTWRSLREAPSSEDTLVREWLISSPPVLREVIVWTKALTSATGGTSERLAKWRPEEQGVGWHLAYEQNGKVYESDFS